MSHRNYEPVTPAASRVLQKKWDDKRMKAHREKVRNVKPTIDNSAPKTYMHVQVKLKKLQQEEERLAKIERDNRMLLERMSTILRTRGAVDNVNDYEHKSLNRSKRQQELVRITQENQAILKRIQARGGSLSRDEWARDHAASEQFKQNITRFPPTEKGATRRRRSSGRPAAEADDSADGIPTSEEQPAEATTAAKDSPSKATSSSAAETTSPEKKPSSSSSSQPQQPQKAQAPQPEARPAGQGTVTALKDFDANRAAALLNAAGSDDEQLILEVLGSCNSQQRLQILAAYENLYPGEKSLTERIKKTCKGDFEKLCLALLMSEADFEAQCLHDAMDGLGTDEAVLIEILVSRSNDEIASIADAYKQRFGSELTKDIDDDTSGYFREILLMLANGNRKMGNADRTKAKQSAQALHDEKDWSGSDSVFRKTLAESSDAQLKAIAEEFQQLTGKSFQDRVEDKFRGDVEKTIVAMVQAAESRPQFFANRIKQSTNAKTLTRIIVSRCEKDLVEIKQAYEKSFGKTLKATVEKETKGSFEKLLLLLIGEGAPVQVWS